MALFRKETEHFCVSPKKPKLFMCTINVELHDRVLNVITI